MRDVAFQCPECRKNLAVGDRFVGLVFSCPDCRATLKAPQPVFVFPCPSCASVLFAPGELRGQAYGCPDCDTPFEVPAFPTVRCGSCGVHLEMDEESYHGVEGGQVECPQCAAKVDVPALPKPVFPETPQPAKGVSSGIWCRGCSSHVQLGADALARMAGKLIRCPKCHGFLRVPHAQSKRRPEPEDLPTRRAQPPKVMDRESGTFARTMRLDDILEDIPQARLLKEEGRCLYCNRPLRQMDARTFVCEHCWRVVRTVRHR